MADNGSTVALLERHAYGPHAESNPRPDANMDDPDASIPALIRELFARAREARRQQLPQWRQNYRALHNRDYKPGATPWDESPAVNQIFPVVSSACAWLTDQRPTIRVTPTAEANSDYWETFNELAGDLNVVISSAFSNYNLSREINRAWWSVHCLTPETRVLTADLQYLPIGSLGSGDEIAGFDEHASGPESHQKRKWRQATVRAVGRTTQPCYRVTLDDGTIITASASHRWLTGGQQRIWRTTEEMYQLHEAGVVCGRGGVRVYPQSVWRALDVWEEDTSREAGYLAGMFDGEGCVVMQGGNGGSGPRIHMAQKRNEALDETERCLKALGFDYSIKPASKPGVFEVTLLGGRVEALRFLGTVRPRRLISRFLVQGGFDKMQDFYGHRVNVARIEPVGEREVVMVDSSTGTYIAEGLAHHNCYGIGYLKTVWEAPLADGLGDAAFRYVDPFTVYPDPYARNQQSLSYIGEIHQMTIEDADRAWPGAAKLLRDSPFFLEDVPEAPHRLDTETDPRRPRVALNKITGTDSTGQPITAQGTPGYHTRVGQHRNDIDSPVVTIMEFYVRDTISERTDGRIDDDADTAEDESQREAVVKVRDDWRCIVVCGDVVLVNRPCSEIYAFPTHPYDRLVLTDTGEWYGPCITEMLTPLQRTINWVLQSLIRNIHLAGNPQMIENPSAVTGHHRFTNRPGQRIQSRPGNVEWMNPPVLQGALATDLVSFLKGEIETISGLSAMVRGFSPQGRNAQGVIDSIQDAAFVRVRASLREMEATLRNVASKMAAFIAEFYTEPRLMSIIGPDGRRTHRALRARHFYALDAEDRGKRIPLRFSLAADAGSSLPTSKQARAAESKHLFELGVIDEYEVLKTLEWPGAPDVTQRVMEAKSRAAMAEQQAGR